MALEAGHREWPLLHERETKSDTAQKRTTKKINTLDALIYALPTDIHTAIIKKVPLEELLKWRVVSKNWNRSIMSGNHFSTEFRNNILLISRFDASGVISLSTYNPRAGQWCSMDMNFLLPVFCFQGRALTDSGYLTGSRIGLLFMICTFRVKLDVETSVIICNPVTKEHKELKVPDRRLRGHAWVIHDDDKRDYSLLITYRGDGLQLVYNSSSESWREVSGPHFAPDCVFSAVSSKGCLYLLKGPRYFEIHVRPTIAVFDPSSDTWSEVHGVPNHIGPDSPRLIETRGRILYVARTFTTDRNIRGGRLSWCMYELELEERSPSRRKMLWARVTEMPRDVYVKLNPAILIAPVYREVRCYGEGTKIFFVGLECISLQDADGRGVQVSVVVHDFRENSWTWIPAFKDEHARFWYWETNSVRMISFRPSLAPVT
ncbi:hypothetical protein R1flu_028718 [Riccia fluitans]|uniref:F-box domain-containing protein n=1 Tax=Riccia fluitans TaxID=41844 RepID=A0ABD1XMH5_9MARC